MRRVALLIPLILGLGGCASTITAIKSRPVAAHEVIETRLWTSTGERRFVAWINRGNGNYLLCPEAVPFTAQSVTSSAKPSLKPSEAIALSTEENYGTGLTTVGTLTENLAALDRNFSNSCGLYMAGVIKEDELLRQVQADNAVRRVYVLAAAGNRTGDKELKAAVDAAVKEAVEKARKELALTLTVSPAK